MAHLVAGGLGGLSFVWGFLPWYTGADGAYLSGYALQSAATGVIALSLLTGAVAVGYLVDRRPAAVLPTLVATAAVLLMIGTSAGRDDLGVGGSDAIVDAGAGLILEFVTVVLQAAVLLAAWLWQQGRLGPPAGRPGGRPPVYPPYPPPAGPSPYPPGGPSPYPPPGPPAGAPPTGSPPRGSSPMGAAPPDPSRCARPDRPGEHQWPPPPSEHPYGPVP